MNRDKIIEVLVTASVRTSSKKVTEAEIQQYREYLQTKTDIQLQNLLMMNCG